MDYSKFLDDEFDAKVWVNNAFKANKETSNDQYGTTLVMKMQMFIQEVNNVIEESCQQAVNNLPRIVRELEAVKQEAVMLQEQMKMVKYDIQKVEHDTAESMQTLMKLDMIKVRMKATSEALREADNWTSLSENVEEVLESRDIDAIAVKLVGMQQSLHILVEVPDYAERCQYLETLKNRLEAIMSPQIVAAFSSQSLEAAQKYASVLASIDRLPQLYRYYHKCHKGNLEDAWKNIQRSKPDASLTEWMSELYDHLLTVWQSQMRWCSQVFDDPMVIVCDLITDCLLSIYPSLSSSIEAYTSVSSQSPVSSLITLRKITDSFAMQLEAAVGPSAIGNATQLACVERLAAAIYLPYQVHISRFPQYEENTLTSALENIQLDHSDVMECVTLLQESVPKLFAAANASNERCAELTSGCSYIQLPRLLQTYFRKYVSQFERVLVNIREKCRLDLPGSDVDEWSAFQNSLRIIQTCGDLILHLDEFDQLLISSIVSTAGKYIQPQPSPIHSSGAGSLSRTENRVNPFRNYKVLLLNKAESQAALELLMKQLEDGDSPTLLDGIKSDLHALSTHIHQFAFDIVFAPLKLHLADVPILSVWKSENTGMALTSNLPDFSLSPQEYITQIGQYLLTLPQQLEPFTMSDNQMLRVALRYGKLPHIPELDKPADHMSNLWLESVARGTMHVYIEQVLKIRELTEQSVKQLITDINYLTNVLDDLGLEPSETLTMMVSLLQASPEQYSELAHKSPQRLASAIASMRCLKLE